MISFCSELFRHKDIQSGAVLDFLKGRTQEEYEVLAFGPSYMFCTFNPVELYRNYGIRSFIPGTACQPVEVSYHYIKQSLNVYRPKVVVLGASMFVFSDGKYLLSDGNAHTAVDGFPSGLEKLRLISNLNVGGTYEEFLFPLVKYHQRWKTLRKNDFEGKPVVREADKNERMLIRGHMAYFQSKAKGVVNAVDMGKVPRAPVCEEYLRLLDEINELVVAHGASLLLLASPRSGALCGGRLATLQDYAAGKGIAFLNLVEEFEKTGIRNETDFRDGWHLNCHGAEKATRYIGKYLVEHYAFETNLSVSVRARWDADCRRYDEAKAEALEAGRKR